LRSKAKALRSNNFRAFVGGTAPGFSTNPPKGDESPFPFAFAGLGLY
jgi:hypothetical protein